MLVSSIFFFSHNVFRRPLPQAPENTGRFGKDIWCTRTTQRSDGIDQCTVPRDCLAPHFDTRFAPCVDLGVVPHVEL